MENVDQTADMDALIGERVHQLMWRSKLPQATVAAALGIDQAAVSRRLRGRTPWKATELIIIAGLLNVDPSALFAAASAGRKNTGELSRCTPALGQSRRLRIVPADEVSATRSMPIRTAS